MERSPRYNPVHENSLFKGFHYLYSPNLKGVEKLQKELAKFPEFKPRLTFHFPLDKERIHAIEMLRSGKIDKKKATAFKESEDFVMWRAREFLLSKTYGLSKGSKSEKANKTLTKDFQKNKHLWLLGSQKALFATPYTKELVDAMTGVQNLSQKLKEKFGDKFIGITVFGGASKGYFSKTDIDAAIIAKQGVREEGIYQYIKEQLPSRHIYELFHVPTLIDWGDEVLDLCGESERLFHGLFFGDNNKLLRLQKTLLEKTNENDWDNLRKDILERETENFETLAGRFGLTQEETEKVKIITMLTRTPPTRDEALKIE